MSVSVTEIADIVSYIYGVILTFFLIGISIKATIDLNKKLKNNQKKLSKVLVYPPIF